MEIIKSLLCLFSFSETTLLYFFSTLAQSFAALTAFFFAAAQVRIAWVDEKITTNKKAILYCFTGTSHFTVNKVDADMCKHSASEVIILGRKSSSSDVNKMADNLQSLILQMQNLRMGVRNFVIVGIALTAIGIMGVLFSKAISNDYSIGLAVMSIVIPAIVV
ncbi:MAG: hypothetical protein EHM20_11930, partial [Alphaproteobacteria bacterium]